MYSGNTGGTSARPKVTVVDVRGSKGVRKIAMLTAYDFTMARLLDDGGADVLLVGDSLGMVVQGHANTLPVTLDEIVYHTKAVARAARRAHVVADMPFMSYQVSPAQAVESAGRLMKDGLAESVKLEGGEPFAEHVARMVQAGIPVMGHVGLMPQRVHQAGGFKVQGKEQHAAEQIVRDARALEDAGAFSLVLEAVPPDVAAAVTRAVTIPTIGIGAGPHCDGQVLVSYDMLGMVQGFSPKFAKRFASLGDAIREATSAFSHEVAEGSFPGPEHTFKPAGVAILDDGGPTAVH